MQLDILFKLVPIFTAFITVIAWFIRLESKIIYLEKDHQAHKDMIEKREERLRLKLDTIQENIVCIKENLARIEERLTTRSY